MLTEKQAYEAAILFLEQWWVRGGKRSEDVAGLLSDMTPGLWADGSSNDPAQWTDWLESVERATDPGKRPTWLDHGTIAKPES
jgi:hypothetical protein